MLFQVIFAIGLYLVGFAVIGTIITMIGYIPLLVVGFFVAALGSAGQLQIQGHEGPATAIFGVLYFGPLCIGGVAGMFWPLWLSRLWTKFKNRLN